MEKVNTLSDFFFLPSWLKKVEEERRTKLDIMRVYRSCMTIMGSFFFCFYKNGVVVKKIINMGQVVLTWHDFICRSRANLAQFCHVSLKSCQLGMTFATST